MCQNNLHYNIQPYLFKSELFRWPPLSILKFEATHSQFLINKILWRLALLKMYISYKTYMDCRNFVLF